MTGVLSLLDLATRVLVGHVDLLRAYIKGNAILAILYEPLLQACVKTKQSLSARHLFLSWPWQKLSLVNCSEFTEEFAIVLVHCLEEGCNELRKVDLTGCNIGMKRILLRGCLYGSRVIPLKIFHVLI